MGHRYELPIVSFAAAILVLLPLPWHWKARNVATLSLIGWLFICNIIRGINSIIWMNNVAIHFHVWCDIATKLLIGVSIALPACSLTLTRHLEHVASVRYGLTTAAEKRRRRIIDLCFTIGIPLVMMALHYVVQGHRFDIVEDIGCQPVIYTSLSGVLLMFGTPLLLSVCSLVYAGLALRHFAIRRLQFEQHLRDSKSAMTTARYMRLMALALTEMVWGVSLGTFVVFENITQSGLRPWVSFADVHYNFSRVAVFPNFLVPNMAEVLLIWWITPSTAILFFVFFGFSDEAREGYKSIWRWICRKVFRRDFSQSEKITSLPQYRCVRPLMPPGPTLTSR
ncbi:fungal pheromone STE3G-protein-coupled receptor [Exidia glandulosa HHB12029]|uniref:Fungal pheromone STE3G-protein-coupled receptor n=1 Tax=Exidia glandulosa HHB12029 TaxID=1314781 RepID=A0A165D7N4_EXIGL|nr:fungal pheromone STE3G-protein-coupled receptor [Exidia glandulosa HHB12029]